MGSILKPGAMGSKSVPDTPEEFADSMAADMEAVLNELLEEEHMDRLPDDNSTETRDRRRLFVAIARGIIEHLDRNRFGIEIELPSSIKVSPTFKIEIGADS